MDISINNVPFVIALAIAAIAIGLNALSAFCHARRRLIINSVNSACHAAFAALMFFAGATLELTVTCLMASVLTYLLSSYASYRLRMSKEGRDSDV